MNLQAENSHVPTRSILLVEDNDIDVDIVQRHLRKLGLDLPIVRARNGEEALDVLLGPNPNRELASPFVVLLDINMPRMNGFELLDELGLDPRFADVPIYILSTSTRPDDQAAAKERSVKGYMIKPLKRDALLAILSSE